MSPTCTRSAVTARVVDDLVEDLEGPVGRAGAGRDVDEMSRFDDLEAVPYALRHDECVARPERVACLGARVVEIAVVEHDNESAGDEIEEFVAIGM